MLQSRSLSIEATLRQSAHALRRRYTQAKPKIQAQRRFNSDTTSKPVNTKPPSPSASYDPSKAPIQIRLPGPSWLWAPLKPLSYPITAYTNVSSSQPYLTQLISSMIIYFLGDLLSQYIQRPVLADTAEALQAVSTYEPAEEPTPAAQSVYDSQRSLRALIIGGTISIPSYHWFMYLSKLWPTLPHMKSLWLKVALNMITFAPLFNAYFFSMHSLLAGDGGDTVQGKTKAAWIRVRNTVPSSWLNGCLFWPVVTAFSFSFVPPRSRSIFAGVAAIGWQSYLGLVNQRAAVRELGRKERKNEG